MENQINVGIQRQPYEPFGQADSDAGNSGAETSLAGDSAGANTSGNPDIVNPHVEGESSNPAPLETIAANNAFNRYGIGDTVILGRPEYMVDSRAATAESAFESNAIKQPEKAPADTTGNAKDAANNSAPANSRSGAVPPHDSAVYAAAREYGVQHGYDAEQVDQAAALLAYYGCKTSEDCVNLLVEGALPFHISSIMQGMGGPRADGTFDVAYSLRSLQEAQIAMSGDRDAGNRNLPDGRANNIGGVGIGSRGSVGQGFLDYAIEMSASSGASDITSIDFSDDSYDASNTYDAPDNTLQLNFDPLPSLPPVDSTEPIMLPTPEAQVEHELVPVPTLNVDDEANSQTPITDMPDAQTESAANEQITSGMGAGVTSAATNPPLTLNPENGQYGRDYGNGVWSYPLEIPQIIGREIPATGNNPAANFALPAVENLYTPFEGFFASSYRTAVRGMTDPNASWDERFINGVLATAVSPLAVVDMMGEGLLNAPNQAARGGQLLARANEATDTETQVVSGLEAVSEFANAFNGAAGPFAGVGVPARVLTTEEQALQRLQSVEDRAAARESYNTLRDNGGLYTSTKPLDDVFPELAGVNPHYVPDAPPGTNVNCVSCANAAQARLSGIDAEATALPSTRYGTPNDLLQSAPLGFQAPTTVAAVEQQMIAAGDGAYGLLRIIQPNSEIEHVVNVVNRNGTVYFVDTQIDRIVTLPPNTVVRLGMPL
jgi:hypothetical protein